MNQILLTEEPDNNNKAKNKNNSFKNDSFKANNPIDFNKIKIFFAIAVIVFGVALIGIFGYKALSKKSEPVNPNNPQEEQISKLQLFIEENDLTEPGNEEDKQVESATIIAKSGYGIEKIIYSWNNEEEEIKTYDGEDNKEIREELDVPAGDNSLYVKAIDESGEEIEDTIKFSIINTELQPKIEISIINEKIKVVATSEIPLRDLRYSWENDDEVVIEPENDEAITIETTIEVKREINNLTITATDCNGNNKTINQRIDGKEKPEITVVKRGDKVHMLISHYKGIKSIVFEINGKKYVYDKNSKAYDETKTEIEYYFTLQEGENKIYITATSLDDTVETSRKKCTYVP